MTVKGTLFTGATVANMPQPGALNPGWPFASGRNPVATNLSQDWQLLGRKMLFKKPAVNALNIPTDSRLKVVFVPSILTATYTVTVWQAIMVAELFVRPNTNSVMAATGPTAVLYEIFDDEPLTFSVDSISDGATLSCYFDDSLAGAF